MNRPRLFTLRRSLQAFWLLGVLISLLFITFRLQGAPAPRSGTLLANSAYAEGKTAPERVTKEPAALDQDNVTTDTQPVFHTDPLETLAESLKAKERELTEREKALQEKEKHLEALRKETEDNLARIEQVFKKMQTIADMASQQKKQEIDTWVTIYQAMAPQKAGEIMQGLDSDLALKLLSQMEPKKAGKILSFVAPSKAIELGKRLDNARP